LTAKQEMPVLSNEDNILLGIVTISDLVKLYDKAVEKILEIRKDNGLSLASMDDIKSLRKGINKSKK
jgi:hypothetical protein